MVVPVPSLDQLSRAELLQLLHKWAPLVREVDIVEAQAAAASDEWRRLAFIAEQKYEAWSAAWTAYQQRPGSLRARRRWEEADVAKLRADRAASRAWTRRTRLWDQLDAMQKARVAA